MDINQCIAKITKYLVSSKNFPIIVDVQNTKDLEKIHVHFNVDGIKFVKASIFSKEDELPRIPKLLTCISDAEQPIFLFELTSHLKFFGDERIRNELNSLLHMSIANHIVIVTYQCTKQLVFSDPRLNNRIYIVDGDSALIPNIIFVEKELTSDFTDFTVDGIQNVANAIENQMCESLYVKTKKRKALYIRACYNISEIEEPYDIVVKKDIILQNADRSLGTTTNWEYLLSQLRGDVTFIELINEKFANHQVLEIAIVSFTMFNENEKWLFFLALKLFGAKNNLYLSNAAMKSSNLNEFILCLYRMILEVDPSDKSFHVFYEQRKEILNIIGNPLEEVVDFCKYVNIKSSLAMYYLTDNTRQEKLKTLELLDKYSNEFESSEIKDALSITYPDLALYLNDFRFKNPLLEKYFSLYKYGKVVNKISDEFADMVCKQAVSREFNLILEHRAAELDTIDKQNSVLYFVDAMGVEYLSYILAKCEEKELLVSVIISKCNLPSITSCNKEFVEEFEAEGVEIRSIKGLDEIKHHGIEEYDYTKTKLPIHLIKELEIIEQLVDNIKIGLLDGRFEKAIVVSDHGASRLAVIQECENIWEMESKGVHSGRCCLLSEADVKSKYAIASDGYWVLANYDRFKGSRKANVEVHGGATLEEVVVPIIEITKKEASIEVAIVDDKIFVSFRKQASITLYIKSKSKEVSILLENKYYEARGVEENIYLIEMPDVKKAKTYWFDVYIEHNLIKKNISFTVMKEGSQEKDLF